MDKSNNIDKELNLVLHSVMPNKDAAWQAGYYAASEEIDLEDNPFSESDDEYLIWQSGWWSGFYEEPNIVEKAVISNEVKSIAAEIAKKRHINSTVTLTHKKIMTEKNKKRVKIAAFSLAAAIAGILAYGYFVEAFA